MFAKIAFETHKRKVIWTTSVLYIAFWKAYGTHNISPG